jgi:hypothetical protein
MKRIISALLAASLLFAPVVASASFSQSVDIGRSQASALSQQQLDSLNSRVFTDAFIAAKIIGFDRTEIDQLTADVRTLKQENAQLKAQLSNRTVSVGSPATDLSGRVSALEDQFNSLQGTLGSIITMLTLVLSKLQ